MNIRVTQRQANAINAHLGTKYQRNDEVPVQTFLTAFDAVLDVSEHRAREIDNLLDVLHARFGATAHAILVRGGASR